MQDNGTAKVNNNIDAAFKRKRAAVYALCLHYSALALKYFRAEQTGNRFWTNRTNLAKDTVFTSAFREGEDIIGWFMAHALQYGVYLELANDRKHESINPVIHVFYPLFRDNLEKLYAD